MLTDFQTSSLADSVSLRLSECVCNKGLNINPILSQTRCCVRNVCAQKLLRNFIFYLNINDKWHKEPLTWYVPINISISQASVDVSEVLRRHLIWLVFT